MTGENSRGQRSRNRTAQSVWSASSLLPLLDRHWICCRSAALDRLATFDSGSKLLALQTLRAIS